MSKIITRKSFKLLAHSESVIAAEAFISDARLIGVDGEMSSTFSDLGYAPDRFKAYMEFNICYALPSTMGPVQGNNIVGYFPQTLADSHESLLHQQLNIRHLLKIYNPDEITQDRIIGCIVATSFPDVPLGGWGAWKIPATPEEAPCIRALAVIFKLAQGAADLVGRHVMEKKKQSVSIEAATTLDNVGVYRPSTGDLWPLLTCPDEVAACITDDPNGGELPCIGKMDGEQLLCIYGMGSAIAFRGAGVTPDPAERKAKITSITAQKKVIPMTRTPVDGNTVVSIAAESSFTGQKVTFKSTGRTGIIEQTFLTGTQRNTFVKFTATPEEPVLKIRLPDNTRILCRYSDVAGTINLTAKK